MGLGGKKKRVVKKKVKPHPVKKVQKVQKTPAHPTSQKEAAKRIHAYAQHILKKKKVHHAPARRAPARRPARRGRVTVTLKFSAPRSRHGAIISKVAEREIASALKRTAKLGKIAGVSPSMARRMAKKAVARAAAGMDARRMLATLLQTPAGAKTSKRILHGLKKRVKRWAKRVKDASHKKFFTPAEIRYAKRTAKAAQDAYDAERGASAIAGEAVKSEVFAHKQADAIWAAAVAKARALGAHHIHGPSYYKERKKKKKAGKLHKKKAKKHAAKKHAAKKKKKPSSHYKVSYHSHDRRRRAHAKISNHHKLRRHENHKEEKKHMDQVTKDMFKTYVDPYRVPSHHKKKAHKKNSILSKFKKSYKKKKEGDFRSKVRYNLAKHGYNQRKLAEKLKTAANYFLHGKKAEADEEASKKKSHRVHDNYLKRELEASERRKRQHKSKLKDVEAAMEKAARSAVKQAAEKATSAGVAAGAKHGMASGAARNAVRKAALGLHHGLTQSS